MEQIAESHTIHLPNTVIQIITNDGFNYWFFDVVKARVGKIRIGVKDKDKNWTFIERNNIREFHIWQSNTSN